MKECLLCTKELKTGEHFTDLIFMNQQEEWICKECKEDFEQIGEIHCPRCFKDKEEKVCKDCEYWIQKGNMVEHEALYRYNAAMKDYFKQRSEGVENPEFDPSVLPATRGIVCWPRKKDEEVN